MTDQTPWTGEKQRKGVAMLTGTAEHRPDRYRQVQVSEEALALAAATGTKLPKNPGGAGAFIKDPTEYIRRHGMRATFKDGSPAMVVTPEDIERMAAEAEKDSAVATILHDYHNKIEADQAVIEQVRHAGVKLTVAPEQMSIVSPTPAERRALLARLVATPKRYTASLSRPSGLPKTREMMLASLAYEAKLAAGVKPMNFDAAQKWEMYFATADFASLFAEMQRDFKAEKITDYVGDILEEWGPSGQIIVGFDLARVPIVRVSKVFNDSTAWSNLPPDPTLYSIPEDPDYDRMSVAALAFQWHTNDKGETALFGGMKSTGDTFRTAAVGSPSIRDVVLMVWMLASRSLRMLEATPQRAMAGVPPKSQDKKLRKAIRDETVTVVTLRHHVKAQVDQVQAAEKIPSRQLTHRFVVRGHWRNQAYGTDRALRRRTYILPYVKGPENAPFVTREKVYQW